MDNPSTIILCKSVPAIGFTVILVFSASARNSGSFNDFEKRRFHRAHAIQRHARRHRVGARVTIRLNQAELQQLPFFVVAREL